MAPRRGAGTFRRAARSTGRFVRSAMPVALQAIKIAREVKALVNTEFKQLITTLDLSVSTTANVLHLTPVVQDTTQTGRIGRKIRMKAIEVRVDAYKHATPNHSQCRLVMFIDKENRGTPPTASDIVASVDTLRGPEPTTRKRFTVLFDKTFDLHTGHWIETFKFFKKLNGHVLYTGVAGTDEGQGSIWMIRVSTEASSLVTIAGRCKITFIDN